MTLVIIGITFLVSIMAFNDTRLYQSLMFEPYAVHARRDLFRLISHGFVHGNWPHLIINMFVLYQFGPPVERGLELYTSRSGALAFVVLYLASLALSSLPAYFRHRFDPSYRAVGASGATSAVVFSCILMYPDAQMMFGPAWVTGIVYLFFEWYMDKRGNDGIAHEAHFAGAVVGILFTALLEPSLVPGLFRAISNTFS